MTRTALNLFLCLALALPISTAAQDFAISDRASAEEQAMLEALIARAEEASGAGTPDYDPSVYYATLETGLMRLMGQAGAEARSASVLSLDPSTIHASDAAIERVSAMDRDSLAPLVNNISCRHPSERPMLARASSSARLAARPSAWGEEGLAQIAHPSAKAARAASVIGVVAA